MDVPRILAIDDVHLTAAPAQREDVFAFYTEVIGLDPLESASSEETVVFRAFPRSGPRLIVRLTHESGERPPRRALLVQVASLTDLAESLTERRTQFEWSRGWFWCDRRLSVVDPGGNWVELVMSHPW